MTGKVHKKSRGFTLIELIVVVAIIGILASLVTLNLLDSAAKARDSRRIADVTQIWKAVQLYKANNSEWLPNLSYPNYTYIEANCKKTYTNSLGGMSYSNCDSLGGGVLLNANYRKSLKTSLITEGHYLDSFPTDPINSGDFFYAYGNQVENSTTNIMWFAVYAPMELQNNANIIDATSPDKGHCYGFAGGSSASSIYSWMSLPDGSNGIYWPQCGRGNRPQS